MWRGFQWILGSQHGRGNHNANQYHVAEVTVIAEPMAKHAKPAKRNRIDLERFLLKIYPKDAKIGKCLIELLLIFYLVKAEIKFFKKLLYLLVLEKIKNAEPAGIGSFLVFMLYSDILRGLAVTSCPSSAKEISPFSCFYFAEFYLVRLMTLVMGISENN